MAITFGEDVSFPTEPLGPYVVEEYPQQEADGSVSLVQRWSDGHYTQQTVQPAPAPQPAPQPAYSPAEGPGYAYGLGPGSQYTSAQIQQVADSLGQAYGNVLLFVSLKGRLPTNSAEVQTLADQMVPPETRAAFPGVDYTGGGGGGVYQTKNGPRTVQQMLNELLSIGWPGGEDIATAYAQTTGGAVTGGTGSYVYTGGGAGGVGSGAITPEHREGLRIAGYGDWANPNLTEADWQRISTGAQGGAGGGTAVMPAQFPEQVKLAIAEMENAIAKAQLALAERKFEEYDLVILGLNQAESELNRQLQTAGVTGYYEGLPTFNRQQWEASIQEQEAQRALQEAGITGQYQGAPTLQAQQLQEQIRQFDTNATLARQQAEAAIRQGDEQLALQSQAQAQQYEIQSQQLQQQLAQITGQYQGAPTLEAQQLQAQIAQFDQQIALTKQQADEARRQFNEGLAWQKEQEVMQLQFQRDQLAQQATQFGQTLGFQQTQLQEQIRQFDQQIAFAHQEAQEATRQFDYTLAWQKEQQANDLQWQRDQLVQQLEYQRQIATGYVGEQPTLEREQAMAGITGYYGGQPTFAREQYVAQQARAPGDWITYLATLRGGLTPEMIPPASQAIMAGQPLPAYAGITPAPRVPGTTGIQTPSMAGQPMRLPSTQAWYGMTPAEQQAHQAVTELQGIPWQEYQAQMGAQAPGTPYPAMSWR